tara:strand:- start:1284 stop:1589 length:306 start_codon:yes stop_codon:yes gene_type:complete
MRSAKTLLKMTEKEKALEMLPNWFQGEVYELGDEVRNPFSGETCLLDAAELSMYDHIKGLELAIIMNIPIFDLGDKYIDIIDKGKDWFLIKNPNAYMILID